MIEVAQLNDLAVRVSGFSRQEHEHRSAFNLVVLLPGRTASNEVSRVLMQRPLTLTIFREDGEKKHIWFQSKQMKFRKPAPPPRPSTATRSSWLNDFRTMRLS